MRRASVFAGRRMRGVTLVEMVVTIVILGIALVFIARSVATSSSSAPRVTLEARAIALAQSYMDEILSRRFDDASPPNGIPPHDDTCDIVLEEMDRADYDDVDDYDGLAEGYDPEDAMAPPLHDAQGNERVGYDRFAVEIEVRCLNTGEGEAAFDVDSNEVKLITVTVTNPVQPNGWIFSAYKVNF